MSRSVPYKCGPDHDVLWMKNKKVEQLDHLVILNIVTCHQAAHLASLNCAPVLATSSRDGAKVIQNNISTRPDDF